MTNSDDGPVALNAKIKAIIRFTEEKLAQRRKLVNAGNYDSYLDIVRGDMSLRSPEASLNAPSEEFTSRLDALEARLRGE